MTLLVFACFLLFSCKQEIVLPIEKKKLVKVLCDVHLAESALQVMNGAAKDAAAVKLYDQICSIHRIERADLDTCLSILKKNPKIAAELYAKVVVEMEELKNIGE